MRISVIMLALALTISTAAHAGNFTFFGNYWETKQGKSYEAVGLGIPERDWQTAFDTHADEGRELMKLDVYDQGGQVFYNFVFRNRQSKSWVARTNMTGSGYQSFFDKQVAAGRCLRALDIYRKGKRIRYAAVFKSHGCTKQRAYHGLPASEHQAKVDAWGQQGWVPINVGVVSIDGKRTYAAFWEKRATGRRLKSFLTRDQLAEVDANEARKRRRLVYLNAYTHDQGQLPRFVGIWAKAPKAAGVIANIQGKPLHDFAKEAMKKKLWARYVTGYGVGSGHRFDAAVYKPKVAFGGAVGGLTSN